MWTFETECLGKKVKSSKSFPTRSDAWEAGVKYADICYENGETVYIKVVPVKES